MNEVNDVNALVMLPPYVAPEHRELLEAAQNALDEYQKARIAQIKKRLDEQYKNIQPHPSDLQQAELEFNADPIRQQLIKNLCNVKLLVERPRFMIKAT